MLSPRRQALFEGKEEPEDDASLVSTPEERAQNWPPLERFGDHPSVPDFPVGALPHWASEFAGSVAAQTQTPRDLAGLLVLAALATACAGKAEVEGRPGYREPLNLWVAAGLPPASRKSAVFRAVAAPIYEREEELAEEWRPQRARAEAEQRVALKFAEKQVRKAADDPSAQLIAADALERARELDDAIPPCPRLIAADATPEAVSRLLAEQGGTLALWTPEGGELFELMLGRYSANRRANLDVFLKGHAGDPVQVDRIGSGSLFVSAAHLTIAITIQPTALGELRGQQGLGGRGLWARFVYALPVNTVGRRLWHHDSAPMTESAAEYELYLGRLLDLPPADRVAHLTAEASELIARFHDALEPRIGPGGDLEDFQEWAGKLVGLVLRVAGLLHAADYADQPDPWESPVDARTMEGAIGIGDYALAHARVACGHFSDPPVVGRARKVWRWIERRPDPASEFARSEAWQATKGGAMKTAEDLTDALEELMRRGYVRALPTERTTEGRPLTLFEVNPDALAGSFRGKRGTQAGVESEREASRVTGVIGDV